MRNERTYRVQIKKGVRSLGWKTQKFIPRKLQIESVFQSMMKISVITDISVLQFYRYIGYIGDISADILEKNIDKLKIDQNS